MSLAAGTLPRWFLRSLQYSAPGPEAEGCAAACPAAEGSVAAHWEVVDRGGALVCDAAACAAAPQHRAVADYEARGAWVQRGAPDFSMWHPSLCRAHFVPRWWNPGHS